MYDYTKKYQRQLATWGRRRKEEEGGGKREEENRKGGGRREGRGTYFEALYLHNTEGLSGDEIGSITKDSQKEDGYFMTMCMCVRGERTKHFVILYRQV